MNEILLLLVIGLLAGVLSGLIGIGGGVIIVPALVFFFGMTQHQAQGTSLAVLLWPVGILAVYNYWKKGFVDSQAMILIAVSFVVGGYIGSRMSIGMSQDVLKKVFAVIMILISVKMIFEK